MSDKVLFLLAGYPGAGKSLLLGRAETQGHPIFGSEHNGRFAALAQHRDAEGRPRVYYTQNDIPLLDSTGAAPDGMILEVDLVSIFSLMASYLAVSNLLPPEQRFLADRPADRLADRHDNELALRRVLRLDIFRRFDVILVNTLYAPWHVCAKQWLDREAKRGRIVSPLARFRHETFFNPATAALCTAIHRSIYDAWIDSIHVLRPRVALLSRVIEGALVMDEVDLGTG
jgi:hypothetical protein